MNKAGDELDGDSKTAQQPEDRAPVGNVFTKLSAVFGGPGWTKVSCPCCVSEWVEPLVLVKLGEKVCPETKRWLIRLIGTPQKDGGEVFNTTGDHKQPRAHLLMYIDFSPVKRNHTEQTFLLSLLLLLPARRHSNHFVNAWIDYFILTYLNTSYLPCCFISSSLCLLSTGETQICSSEFFHAVEPVNYCSTTLCCQGS